MAENETSEVFKPEVEVVNEEVPAQVAPPRDPDSDTVEVHETSVALDRVITDPSSPEAVQVPDAGKGSLELPAHALDAPSPEEALESGDAEEFERPENVDGPDENE